MLKSHSPQIQQTLLNKSQIHGLNILLDIHTNINQEQDYILGSDIHMLELAGLLFIHQFILLGHMKNLFMVMQFQYQAAGQMHKLFIMVHPTLHHHKKLISMEEELLLDQMEKSHQVLGTLPIKVGTDLLQQLIGEQLKFHTLMINLLHGIKFLLQIIMTLGIGNKLNGQLELKLLHGNIGQTQMKFIQL